MMTRDEMLLRMAQTIDPGAWLRTRDDPAAAAGFATADELRESQFPAAIEAMR